MASKQLLNLNLPDAEVLYQDDFFNESESNDYFQYFKSNLIWTQGKITIFGKRHSIPRLHAWYGDPGASYTYSNLTLQPLTWDLQLLKIKKSIEENTGHHFNCVLTNLYRNGQDSNGWHSDDEKELGINPTLASVSFGVERRFDMRHKSKQKKEKYSLILKHGSLLLMSGTTQHHWKHQIAKSKKVSGARINLTFRLIKP